MGSCCTNNSNLISEQFIRDILQDESLTIRNYNYNELLNEIVSKRIEQEIPKEHIKQFLIPEFYDSKKTQTNGIYIEAIFNYILEHLEDRNNMYTVLLYFYPFIKHEEEKVEQVFFNILRFITQSRTEINKEKVKFLLFNYISFCSWGITNSIKDKLPTPDELSASFESLLNGPYSEDKLNTGYKISQSFNENVYVGEYGVCTNGENTYVISYEDANKVYKEMYGTEMPKKGFTTVNFGGQFYHFYDYIEELDSFVALKCGACGGSCGEPEDKSYELKTATLTGNELVIVVNYDNSEYEILFTKNNNNYIFKSFGKK